jgi:hypothetical protein
MNLLKKLWNLSTGNTMPSDAFSSRKPTGSMEFLNDWDIVSFSTEMGKDENEFILCNCYAVLPGWYIEIEKVSGQKGFEYNVIFCNGLSNLDSLESKRPNAVITLNSDSYAIAVIEARRDIVLVCLNKLLEWGINNHNMFNEIYHNENSMWENRGPMGAVSIGKIAKGLLSDFSTFTKIINEQKIFFSILCPGTVYFAAEDVNILNEQIRKNGFITTGDWGYFYSPDLAYARLNEIFDGNVPKSAGVVAIKVTENDFKSGLFKNSDRITYR